MADVYLRKSETVIIAEAIRTGLRIDGVRNPDAIARGVLKALAGAGVHLVSTPEIVETPTRVGFSDGLTISARAYVDGDLVSYDTQAHQEQIAHRSGAFAKIANRHLERRLLETIAERLGFGQR